jgi:hypothetical protein
MVKHALVAMLSTQLYLQILPCAMMRLTGGTARSL